MKTRDQEGEVKAAAGSIQAAEGKSALAQREGIEILKGGKEAGAQKTKQQQTLKRGKPGRTGPARGKTATERSGKRKSARERRSRGKNAAKSAESEKGKQKWAQSHKGETAAERGAWEKEKQSQNKQQTPADHEK